MENENNQDIDLENNEETVEETTTETTEDTVDYKAEAETAKAEALKWKAIAERNKKKSALLPKDDDIRKSVAELQFAERKRQFGYEHGLSPEETDAVFKVNPNPTKEDLEDPFIKGGLESIRAKRRVESNTPSPSSKTFKVNGKTFSELTPEEKEANWSKYQQSLGRK